MGSDGRPDRAIGLVADDGARLVTVTKARHIPTGTCGGTRKDAPAAAAEEDRYQ